MANTSNNPYSDMHIDRERIKGALEGIGCSNYSYVKAGSLFHLQVTYDGKDRKMNVFEKKNGTTTISKHPSLDDTVFNLLATTILRACACGNGNKQYTFTFTSKKADNVTNLVKYLTLQSTKCEEHTETRAIAYTLTGTQGDKLKVTHYHTGSVVIQGAPNKLSVHATAYLSDVLDLGELIAFQHTAFKIDVDLATVDQAVRGKIPNACVKTSPVVIQQLKASFILDKIDVSMPDYAAFCTPVFKALEAHLWHELKKLGFKPTKDTNFGEYFEATVGTSSSHSFKAMSATMVTNLVARHKLEKAYSFFHQERHGLLHVDKLNLDMSRTLANKTEAQSIINIIVNLIEDYHS